MRQLTLPKSIACQKTILLFPLSIVLLFYLSGCATIAAVDWAEQKASPELNCDYRKIKSVVSAVKQQNGDISICIELIDIAGKEAPKLKTVTLPFSDLTGTVVPGVDIESSSSPSGCPIYDRLYPVEKTKKGCGKISSGNESSRVVLPIERLEFDKEDKNRLYDLLNIYTKGAQYAERLYEINFVNYENGTENATNGDEAIDHQTRYFVSDVLFVYWPNPTSRQKHHPIIIAGTYEDQSTAIGRLIYPLAVAVDIAIVAGCVALTVAYPPAALHILQILFSSGSGSQQTN